MSSEPERKSEPEQGQPKNAFVLDFLYHDARRIGSFLAQFDPSGTLKQITDTVEVGASATSKAGREQGLAKIVVAKAMQGAETTESERRAAAKVYDPLWANALNLLDIFEQHSLIKNSIHDASIGQIIRAKGTLKVLDLRLLKEASKTPILKNLMTGDPKKISKEQYKQNIAGMELLLTFPHTIQAQLFEPQPTFSGSWMTLDEAGMVISPSDILMKHGLYVAGEWTMIGIKDAYPDKGAILDTALQELAAVSWEHAAKERVSTMMAIGAELLAPGARMSMGRPGPFYGVTPLMIFREISG